MRGKALPARSNSHNYQPHNLNTMSYMQDLEQRLEKLLSATPEGEREIIIREIKRITLESYRNGQEAGPARKPEQRQAAKRRYARNYQK